MPRFTPRLRKHKQIARAKDQPTTNTNTNQETIIPESQFEREARRLALQQELRSAQPESKVSSKKRKRQDKYIETKLKKEENAELLKKLEGQKVDTSLLRSSKTLGRVKESKREKLSRALREKQAGIDGEEQDGLLYQRRRDVADIKPGSRESRNEVDDAELEQDGNDVPRSFGSGLKRPLEVDEEGQPMIKKRKRQKKKKAAQLQEHVNGRISPATSLQDGEEEEWAGFSSDQGNGDGAEPDALEDDEDSESESSPKPTRKSGFTAFMEAQRNDALDFTPSSALPSLPTNFKPRAPSPDPMLEAISTAATITTAPTKPAAAITITRPEEIQAARLHLPVVQEEQKIVEAINLHPVVVVCGATGSGKTTQVPQMLLENGYASRVGFRSGGASASPSTSDMPLHSKGMIGVTQPRRIAATNVAARVKHELGWEFGRKVAHQVRYDSNVGWDTAIKFMTDGILLREIQQDFFLSRYSVIVLDEAHERSVNTDVLIGLLARIVPVRAKLAEQEPEQHYPLKLVIMSATLSHGVNSFLKNAKLWKPFGGTPPLVEAEGRQFPVTVHFSRKTRRDYVDEMVDKVARGHRKLPQGGMLVFLTGQDEIQTVAKKLRQRLGGSNYLNGTNRSAPDVDDYEDGIAGFGAEKNDFLEGEDDSSDADSDADIMLDEGDDAEFAIEDAEAPPLHESVIKGPLTPHILPLYAALPPEKQQQVFNPPPPGTRLIVVATNVAETSLTIPNIRYVFDCGRAKEKKYNVSTGVQIFEVDWISQAAAEQRKGRAGRTAAGHVWRLYSSAVFEQFFPKETVPEILRTPLESTVLQLKSIAGLGNVMNFPFPTLPEKGMLEKAEVLLRNLGAIDKSQDGAITDLGKSLMKFPVNPRYGKMLWLAQRNGVVALTVAMVAGLAVDDLFMPEALGGHDSTLDDLQSGDEDYIDVEGFRVSSAQAQESAENRKRHQAYTSAQTKLAARDEHSDAIKVLTSIAAYADHKDKSAFCKNYWLKEKALKEVHMLRRQLHSIAANSGTNTGFVRFEEKVPQPPDKTLKIVKEIVAAGYIDQIAIRADALPNASISFGRKPRRAIEVPYRTLFPSTDPEMVDPSAGPVEQEFQRSVFVHSSSVLARLSPGEMPAYVVYSHLSRATVSKTNRTRMHPLAAIGPRALASLAENTPLLHIGAPVGKVEALSRDGEGRQRRQCWVNVSLRAPGNKGVEWPLSVWKVVQRRGDRDWEVERVVAR